MKNHPVRTLKISIIFFLLFASCKQSAPDKKQDTSDDKWLEEITISGLQQGYKNKEYSITDVVSAYLRRINEIDLNGPALNSIIKINPDALKIAEELDKEMAAGKIRGPMH